MGGFPLHLLRELFMAFHTLQSRIVHFYNYTKIIKVLDTQFPTITRQELIDSERDVVCVICFSEMETGKELPCKHVFHLNCLRRWFEQKQECPMCRMKIVPSDQPVPNPQRANVNIQPQIIHEADNKEDDDDDDTTTDTQTDTQTSTRSRTRTSTASNMFMPYPPPMSPPQHHHQQQHPYYAMPYPYPVQQQPQPPMSSDPQRELEELTRITQWKIEYYEMRANQLKSELEQFIQIQSKWKNEQEASQTTQQK